MKNPILRKEFLLGIKIVSLFCALFLTGIEVYNQIKNPVYSKDSFVDYYSLSLSKNFDVKL